MDDFDAIAARLFGSTAPSAAPAPAQDSPASATGEQTAAERLFGVKPQAETQPRPELRDDRAFSELSEAEQAQRLYGSTDPTLTHADATVAIRNAAMQDHLHDPDTAGEIAAGWAATFSQHQLNATESKDLADIGASVMRTPPTPELVTQWTETAIANLQAEYGVQGAGQALDDARRYVASHPGLPDLIDALGLGAHPKLVALAAARGRALRLAGKLKG